MDEVVAALVGGTTILVGAESSVEDEVVGITMVVLEGAHVNACATPEMLLSDGTVTTAAPMVGFDTVDEVNVMMVSGVIDGVTTVLFTLEMNAMGDTDVVLTIVILLSLEVVLEIFMLVNY